MRDGSGMTMGTGRCGRPPGGHHGDGCGLARRQRRGDHLGEPPGRDKSGGGPITAFEATEDFATRIACEVKDFDPLLYMDKRDARRYDRVSQFALAASSQAMASAGLEGVPEGMEPRAASA